MKSTSPRRGPITAKRIAVAIVVLGVAGSALAYRYGSRLLGGSQVSIAQISPDLAQRLVSGPDLPAAGNPSGVITIAAFFDYRCPYCRMMQPRLEALIAKDKRVRLVFKEWPVMSGVSVTAARLALATQWQDKYLLAHNTLIALPIGL